MVGPPSRPPVYLDLTSVRFRARHQGFSEKGDHTMRKTLASIVAIFVLFPLAAYAQNGKVTLDGVAKAMGAANLKSYELTANGMSYAVGQSEAPGAPWPRFTIKSTKGTVNDKNLISKVEGLVAHPVVGDMPLEITYSTYQDFGGGVMFPRVIEQTAGGFPSL